MFEIYFETYGCTANYNSTEIMKGLVKQAGLNITNNLDYADLIVINSCIVKEPTEEKIRRRISDLIKKYSEKKIILAGCMTFFKEKLNKENLFVLSNIKDINRIIYDIKNNEYDIDEYSNKKKESKTNLPKISKERYIGINQISEGCLGNCSFCITKKAKGKLYSFPKEDIINSVKNDLNSGVKEIQLTSQDCASYGNDNNKNSLPVLLKEILEIKNKFYLRIGMMNPNNITKILDELIEIYKNKKIYKFLHLPIQSGSNKILKKMNRNYKIEDVFYIIDKFREVFPDIHISTDVIVGFPSETKEDFNKTFKAIKKINPETINISKFWPRQGTKAEKFENNVDSETKKQRVIELSKLHKQLCVKNQKRFLNKDFKVLVNQKGFENTFLARNENYKLFAVISNKKILGRFLKVRVKKITPHYLISEIVE